MNYGSTLVVLLFMGYVAWKAYQEAMKLWKESAANEWMLVLRNGEMVKCGIGLNTWIQPTDQAIKFPSLINQVNFNAQQVTSEMQGVEVTGMIIWSVHREGDGPFKCYKSFGKDLEKKTPTIANAKLSALAVSIIRDRIANMSLDEILKNRSKLRSGVKEEIQKLLTGWGIWLETVEIQDVKIMSGTLFQNLQTEFKEKSRQEAEKIRADIQLRLEEEKLVRDTAMSKNKVEAETKDAIFKKEQAMQMFKQRAQTYQKELTLAAKKDEIATKKSLKW